MKEMFNCEDQFHNREFTFIWHCKRAVRKRDNTQLLSNLNPVILLSYRRR